MVAALVLLALGTVVLWQTDRGNGAKAATASAIEVTQGAPVVPSEFQGDVRSLPRIRASSAFKPELELVQPFASKVARGLAAPATVTRAATRSMPSPAVNFDGLDHDTWGAGWPPDTVGDVGTSFYVQAVNTSIGIFAKTGGAPLAAFTFNTLWNGVSSGTACDANHMGDPTVIYDPMADRYIVADFAWTDLNNGPYYECIAVSKTGNPVTGGWWLYAVRADDAGHPWLPDYPKMGIWPDGLYMTANMFDCGGTNCSISPYQEVRAYAFNRSDLESGATLRSRVVDLGSATYFSLVPSNLRGAAPPAGRENLLVSESQSLFAWEVWKFHVDWTTPGNSTFSSSPTTVSQTSYNLTFNRVPSSANMLDSLADRVMMQVQYRNLAGTESLWVDHSVPTGAPGPYGIQWAQINVTGGTVNGIPVQQQIYGNLGSDGIHRWMPSLAVDSAGNMAVGYSGSKAGMNPDIRYSGRLSSDTLGTLAQGEGILQSGGGSQNLTNRWGDYSAMTVDPVDDCTFWYTTEYYAATGSNWKTRISSFKFPSCTATPHADLEVTKTGPATSPSGNNVSYGIALTNHGPSDAASVSLVDTVPSSSTFVSASQSTGPTFACTTPSPGGTGDVSCTKSTLASGASATFTVVVHPSVGTTSLSNTATASTSTNDPGPNPNSDTVDTTIGPPDTTDPQTTIDTHPPNPSTSTSASFTFSADEPTTFECSLDGAVLAACTSPQNYTLLVKRSHVFEVVATDLANNTDASPATFAWTNGKVPTTKITPKPPAFTNSTLFTFISSDPGATFECSVDLAPFSPCTSPAAYPGLLEGPHTFGVRSIDVANRAGKAATAKWTVDLTPPVVSIVKKPTDPTTSTNATFGLASNETKSTFECSLDGAGFIPCKKSITYKFLVTGPHTFSTRATDRAGNTSGPTGWSWTITP
jgi:uncharacterized repeat protein (TIGR01451 family)